MEIDRHVCAGGVVYRRAGAGCEVLLVQDRFGRWALPKGHVEAGETTANAALREVLEETGVAAALGESLGQTVYTLPGRGGGAEKVVHYYLMEAAPDASAAAQPAEGTHAVRWVRPDEAATAAGYGNLRALLAVAAVRLVKLGADA